MKEKDYAGPIMLLLVVSFFGFIAWYKFYGEKHYEFLYPPCEYSGPSKIEMKQIGTVKTSDNEVCKVEEAVEFFYDYDWKDSSPHILNKQNKCWMKSALIEIGRKPLVRRMICPSGLNGKSTVTDDGTKFHHEVLQ